jgi:hypothetical protein
MGQHPLASNCMPFTPERVTNSHNFVQGAKLLRSTRWAADPQTPKVCRRGIPFILNSGHFSGSILCTWRCDSYQWFATTLSLLIRKLRQRRAVSRYTRYKSWSQVTKIAILYILTSDDRMLERLLNCQKKGFVRTFCYYLNTLDDKNRFLYDQALSGASWFELRGNPRVQSSKKTVVDSYRNFSVKSFDSNRLRRERANEISDPWIIGLNGCFKYGGFPCALHERIP